MLQDSCTVQTDQCVLGARMQEVDIPQPPPEVVDLPPAQHPVPPPLRPPEITEPWLPGRHQPITEPSRPNEPNG